MIIINKRTVFILFGLLGWRGKNAHVFPRNPGKCLDISKNFLALRARQMSKKKSRYLWKGQLLRELSGV